MASAEKSTVEQCAAYVTKVTQETGSNFAKSALCIAKQSAGSVGSVVGSVTSSSSSSSSDNAGCTGECAAAFDGALSDARAAGRADCIGVRQVIATAKISCLKDGDGSSCGGLSAITQGITPISNLLGALTAPATAASLDTTLDGVCTNTCYDKAMNLFSLIVDDSVAMQPVKLLTSAKGFLCKKISGNYCLHDFRTVMQTIGSIGETPSVSVVKSKLCNNCARVAMTLYADMTMQINGESEATKLLSSFLSKGCMKNKKGEYCLRGPSDAPGAGPCIGKAGNDPECKAHLEKHRDMGCCTPISCSMDTACDEEESKDLFSEAGLEYPTARWVVSIAEYRQKHPMTDSRRKMKKRKGSGLNRWIDCEFVKVRTGKLTLLYQV